MRSTAPELTRADGTPLRVLVVDDEENIAELLRMALRYEGWDVEVALTGSKAVSTRQEAAARRRGARHDAARLRRHGGAAPAARRPARRTRALPDRPRLRRGPGGRPDRRWRRLRHQAVLAGGGRRPAPRADAPGRRAPGRRATRRCTSATSSSTRTATRSAATATSISLTATEFELLRFLMRNPRRVLSKAQILDRVWNYDFGGQANVVELYISYLRKKIDAGRRADDPHDARRRLRAQADRARERPTCRLPRSSLTVPPGRHGGGPGRRGVRADRRGDHARDAQLPLRPARPAGGEQPRRAGPTAATAAARRSAATGARARHRARGRSSAVYPDGGADDGVVVGTRSATRPAQAAVHARPLEQLDEVPADGEVHSVDLTGLGELPRRSPTTDAGGNGSSTGLPSRDVDDILASLIWWEALLALLGVARGRRRGHRSSYAASCGRCDEVAATAHEVAALPLATGEIGIDRAGAERISPTSGPRSARSAPR